MVLQMTIRKLLVNKNILNNFSILPRVIKEYIVIM